MTPSGFRKLLLTCDLRQVDAAWLLGVHVRQVRAWCLGEYPVPQYASLIVSAFAEGVLSTKWLVNHIDAPPP